MNEIQEPKLTWKKVTGGTFRMANGKIIKPGQVFQAAESEIPKAFRDGIKLIEGVISENKEPEAPQVPEVPVARYFKKERKPGWYDVVDVNGKVISEKIMREHIADEFLNRLNSAE